MGAEGNIEANVVQRRLGDHRQDVVPESKRDDKLLPGKLEQVPAQYISRALGDRNVTNITNVFNDTGKTRVQLADATPEANLRERRWVEAKPDAGVCPADNKPEKNPDMKIDGVTRHNVIDNLIKGVKDKYISPDVVSKVEKLLRSKEGGEYSHISSAKKFADTVTHDLQSLVHDKHLRLFYFDKLDQPGDGKPSPDEVAKELKRQECHHSGIESAKTLPGNIGYLKIDGFYPTGPLADPRGAAMVTERIASEMAKIADRDALIIDLRENHGGDPHTVLRALDYLLKPGTNVNNIVWRQGDSSRIESFVTSEVDGPKFGSTKPIYILTSKKTFSGAEEFSYDLQALGRAALVGRATGGGANPGEGVSLDTHFIGFVPTGRSINPITGKNWEGEGVQPDHGVRPKSALDVAQVMAIRQLLKGATGEHLSDLRQRLAELNAKLRIKAR